MIAQKPLAWGKVKNQIRTIAELCAEKKAEIGAENVYDYSMGNPNVPAPACINEAIIDLVKTNPNIHSYTTAAGIPELRKLIAKDVNGQYGLNVSENEIYVTCGANAGLAICMYALLNPGDEVILFAPYFIEYKVFVEYCGGTAVIVPPDKDFQINLEALKEKLSPKTKAVLINSPNNPSGVVFDEENIKGLAKILKDYEKESGNTIYAVTDEPYRELVYDMDHCPCIMNYYDDSMQCYSYSKVISLPGERIGYIAVSDRAKDCEDVCAAIGGAGRCLGYVNPPSLFQHVLVKCYGAMSDMNAYRVNRDILSKALSDIGYEFVKPQGGFYLFLKSPDPDAVAFARKATEFGLFIVPSDDFGCEGYIRLAYCVKKEMIEKSIPAFKALYDYYKNLR